jgi:Prolipoprotein diacylglyceryltransferase
MRVEDFDDFILWVTLGIILGGRIGYVLFYNPAHYAAHPLEILELWHGGMSFHGGFLGCVATVMLFGWKRGLPVLSLGDLTCAAAPIGLFLGRIAISSTANSGAGRPTWMGPWCFRAPARCRGIPASFMKPGPKVSCFSSSSMG